MKWVKLVRAEYDENLHYIKLHKLKPMITNFNEKIFFYCYPSSGNHIDTAFQHLIICIAEGLKELGIPFYSNIDYWQESPETDQYLFRHNPDVTPDDCSIVVLQHDWFCYGRGIPENLFHANRNYTTVYLDGQDGNKTFSFLPEFKQFDLIFKTHYTSKFNYPSNAYPWAFGLSNRVIREMQEIPKFLDRNKLIIVNYRNNRMFIHSVRKYTNKKVLPLLRNFLPALNFIDNTPPSDTYHYLHWIQTAQRHYPSYYKRLKESAACACFGGFFVPPWPKDQSSRMSRLVKRLLSELGLKSKTIVQWDSWRLWETLAAGCVAFHVDFDKYGFTPPVKPRNWQHYIGIDLDNIQATIDRLEEEPASLERIANQGRNWAIEHYSPVPTALRFLETVSKKRLSSATTSCQQTI